DSKRWTGAALTGHLVAVETGDDGGCLAGDIQQNGSRRAAVHSPIANARKHDDGGNRIELERSWQKQSDRRGGADPPKATDQGPHSDTDKTVEKVLRLQRDVKAVGKTS